MQQKSCVPEIVRGGSRKRGFFWSGDEAYPWRGGSMCAVESLCDGPLFSGARGGVGGLGGGGEFPCDEGAFFLFEDNSGLLGDVVEDLLAASGLLASALNGAGEEPVNVGRFAGGFVDYGKGDHLAEDNPKT